MSNYAVACGYECYINNVSEGTYELKVFLQSADSEAEIWELSNSIGEAGSQTYENSCQEKVEWRFLKIYKIMPIFGQLVNGCELYSAYFEKNTPNFYELFKLGK